MPKIFEPVKFHVVVNLWVRNHEIPKVLMTRNVLVTLPSQIHSSASKLSCSNQQTQAYEKFYLCNKPHLSLVTVVCCCCSVCYNCIINLPQITHQSKKVKWRNSLARTISFSFSLALVAVLTLGKSQESITTHFFPHFWA